MKKILFFDTETTGFPSGGPLSSQPYIVQIAGMFGEYSDDFTTVLKEETFDLLFRPEGSIPVHVIPIHGIDDDMVKDRPMLHEDRFITDFMKMMDEADIICGHNVEFDFKMIAIQIDRLMEKFPGKNPDVFIATCRTKGYCTMMETIDFCQLPGGKFGAYKWPKLIDLHIKLFGEGFDSAHNALADITATKKCFFELSKRGVVTINPRM